MANLKVSIIEKVKINGRWTNTPVKIPKQKPGAKGFYLQDRREGKFLIVWREGGRKRYSDYIGSLPLAVKAKEQKESYLASIAKGLKVEECTDSKARLTIAIAIHEFLAALNGRGNTIPLYTSNLRQFEHWNAYVARIKMIHLDTIDRAQIMAYKKWCQQQGGKNGVPNDELTAVWKCIRLNRMIKDMLKLEAGKGPVSCSDFSEVLGRKPRVTTYRKDEIVDYLNACRGSQLVLWTLFLKCGLRYKELSYLEWTDIDFTTHVLHVRKKILMDGDKAVEFTPKKCSIRDVAIPDDVVAGLMRLKTISNSHLVFPTRSGRINTKLWDSCKRIAGKSGVTDIAKFKPKNFRSTFATNRLRNNYTLADIRDQLGHRDIHSVEHYLHPGQFQVT